MHARRVPDASHRARPCDDARAPAPLAHAAPPRRSASLRARPIRRSATMRCREIFLIKATALARGCARCPRMRGASSSASRAGGTRRRRCWSPCTRWTCSACRDATSSASPCRASAPRRARTRRPARLVAGARRRRCARSASASRREAMFAAIGHDAARRGRHLRERAGVDAQDAAVRRSASQVRGIDLGTGDLSELALGFATYGGDHMSHYGVNAGVPKTLDLGADPLGRRRRLPRRARRRRRRSRDVLDTPISPELLRPRPGRRDRAALGGRSSAPTSCTTSSSTTCCASASARGASRALALHAFDGPLRARRHPPLAARLPAALLRQPVQARLRPRRARRSAPAARCRRAATGACRATRRPRRGSPRRRRSLRRWMRVDRRCAVTRGAGRSVSRAGGAAAAPASPGGERPQPPRKTISPCARIVRRDRDGHTIAGNHADVVAPHASADLGQELHAVVALHAVVSAGEGFDDGALDLNEIVACQEDRVNTGPQDGQRARAPIMTSRPAFASRARASPCRPD